MKETNVFILGDSYSTYEGYNPENYLFYYSDGRTDLPVVQGVEKTWWKLLSKEAGLQVVMNDSYSGSTVCNTVRSNFTLDTSFVNRLDRYIAEDFFAKNDIGTLFLFGGTNDSWIDCPIGAVQYGDWTEEDLLSVLPAMCRLIDRAKQVVDRVVVIINSDLKQEITDGFVEACEQMKVQYVRLQNVDKVNGHPTELGMEHIAQQVMACLN